MKKVLIAFAFIICVTVIFFFGSFNYSNDIDCINARIRYTEIDNVVFKDKNKNSEFFIVTTTSGEQYVGTLKRINIINHELFRFENMAYGPIQDSTDWVDAGYAEYLFLSSKDMITQYENYDDSEMYNLEYIDINGDLISGYLYLYENRR